MNTSQISRTPEGLDLLNADLFANGHPHEIYDTARRASPVHRQPGSELQPPFWALTKFDDIRTLAKDGENFTTTRGFRISTDNRSAMDPEVARVLSRFMLAMDNPEHMHFRNQVVSSFSPSQISRLKPLIEAGIDDLIASLPVTETVDFITDVAAFVPIKTICIIMGIPEGDEQKVFDFTNAVFGTDDPDYATSLEDANQKYLEIFDYGWHLLEERRRNPEDDLLSKIAHAEVDGRSLSRDEKISYFSNLVAAGNETTRSSLSGAVWGLWRYPEQRRMLTDDLSLMTNAIKELLRWYSPVFQMARTAVRDTSIGGQSIAAGERVAMLYGAGNHDPAQFENPHDVIIQRANASDHISFGFGIHHCLGFRLALLQLDILMQRLLSAFPDYQIESEPVFLRSNFVQAMKSLPVRLAPRPV